MASAIDAFLLRVFLFSRFGLGASAAPAVETVIFIASDGVPTISRGNAITKLG
jgi:hypothetical protein